MLQVINKKDEGEGEAKPTDNSAELRLKEEAARRKRDEEEKRRLEEKRYVLFCVDLMTFNEVTQLQI